MQSDVVMASGNHSGGCFLKVTHFRSIIKARHTQFSCKIMVFRPSLLAVENHDLADFCIYH